MEPPWLFLGIVNVVSFLLMGLDKLDAKIEIERVPELWFILISLAGGFCGVILRIFAFHHKVSKPTFQLKILAATAISMSALLILILKA